MRGTEGGEPLNIRKVTWQAGHSEVGGHTEKHSYLCNTKTFKILILEYIDE